MISFSGQNFDEIGRFFFVFFYKDTSTGIFVIYSCIHQQIFVKLEQWQSF